MFPRKVFFAFLLWLIPLSLSAQRYISGRITDSDDGFPIPGVHVFIANTTVGTTTDTTGYYRLAIPGEGSYRLAVSHVGYQPVFKDIEPNKTSIVLHIAMNTYELEEITVSVKVQTRKRDVDFFWKTLLGTKPSKKTVHVLNPEAVYFYYNPETQKLTVTCRTPLQIVNNETGYQIQYILDRFTHNYNTKITSWAGECKFDEIEPNNFRQKNLWEKNRKKVFLVSINHFIKSLYHDTLMENGFLLMFKEKPDINPLTITNLNKFLTINPADNSKTLYIPHDLSVLLFSYGKPLSENDFANVLLTQYGKWGKWNNIGLYRNIVRTSEPVQIFPDGTFKNSLELTPVLNSTLLTGINMTLPVDYDSPDVDPGEMSLVVKKNHSAKFSTDVEQPVNSLTDSLNRIVECFEMQLNIFPQEKVHLHTDKPYYISGERIWFRAYVVDAASHIPITAANCVYVDLFDVRDSVVRRVKIGLKNNTYIGHLDIPADIPSGNYTIRAYTGRMRNLNEDYFFMKNIRIGDPMNRMIRVLPEFGFTSNQKINTDIHFSSTSPSIGQPQGYAPTPISPESLTISINNGKPIKVKTNKNGVADINFNLLPGEKQRVMLLDAMYNKHPYRQYIRIPFPDDDFDVSFYPEGGSALYGCMGRIAVKAMQRDGTEIDVSGIVYDRQGNEITQFKTSVRGMGQFVIMPEHGETYYAICTNNEGQSKRFDLPAAKEDAYALSATWVKDNLIVKVNFTPSLLSFASHFVQSTSGEGSGERLCDTLCLMVHTRGVVQDVYIWKNISEPIVFQKDFFPSGVSNLLLLTKDMTPISERLVFVCHDDHAKVECKANRDVYSIRRPVEYTVRITDKSGDTLRGNFSVSITDDHEVAVDTMSNILTSLLLSSDLRGHISDPSFYFQNNIRSAWGLELLMLTQGWRRYDTERIVRNDFMYPDSLFEKGYEISGTVKRQSLMGTKPEENANVSILSLYGDYFGETVANRNGRFFLHDGEVSDSTWLIVQATPQSGKNNLELTLDNVSYPERTIPVVASENLDYYLFAKYSDRAEQQYIEEHGTRIIQLPEVTITAERKQVRESIYYSELFKYASLTQEQIEKFPPANLNALLWKIPGVIVEGGRVSLFRFGGCPARIVIDYFIVEDINNIVVDDIAQVDVFVPTGSCGVIVMYTKEGAINSPKKTPYIKKIMPLGFQKPAEFYAPKYNTPAQTTKPDLRTTIHWQPSLATDEKGMASFSFYTADAPSTYTVVIEGVTDDGKIVYKRDKIKVR